MKTKAVRLYGKNDLRLEEFELPAMGDDEIAAQVVSDSICMSSYKAALQGSGHKRVPDNLAKNPVIIGHEFCGEILAVGKKWRRKFQKGRKFSIQPALNYQGSLAAPGYSFSYLGGDATRVIIPNAVMEMDCLLDYHGEAYFFGSLAEPVSCIVGAFHANFHVKQGGYAHQMGIKQGGQMAILAGAGPMGLGAIDYALHGSRKPASLVVVDIDQERLRRASTLYPPEEAEKSGVKLKYVNTGSMENSHDYLLSLSGGQGYDDLFVFAAVPEVVEQGDSLLARDGCLNFFAGPTDPRFSASLNLYNVHYASHHLVGTSGGNSADMREALRMMSRQRINPAAMITHVGGLNAVPETTLNLPKLPGGKKLIYTHIDMPLTALGDFKERADTDPFYARLADIMEKNNGLWCLEAERYLLTHAKRI